MKAPTDPVFGFAGAENVREEARDKAGAVTRSQVERVMCAELMRCTVYPAGQRVRGLRMREESEYTPRLPTPGMSPTNALPWLPLNGLLKF